MEHSSDAENAYRAALKIQEELAADFPNIPEYRSQLAHSHNNLGFLLDKTGLNSDAEHA